MDFENGILISNRLRKQRPAPDATFARAVERSEQGVAAPCLVRIRDAALAAGSLPPMRAVESMRPGAHTSLQIASRCPKLPPSAVTAAASAKHTTGRSTPGLRIFHERSVSARRRNRPIAV